MTTKGFGPASYGPVADYVFEHVYLDGKILSDAPADYEGLRPLAEVEAYTRDRYCLPRRNIHADAADRSQWVEEKIEEGYLYLFDHEHRVVALEEEVAELRKQVSDALRFRH